MLVRTIKLGTVATTFAFAGLLTFNAVAYAQGQDINNSEQRTAAMQQVDRESVNRDGRSSWLTGEEKQALVADVLGMTVEELTAAKEAGQDFEEIVEAQGMTMEEFKAAKQAALIAVAEQAVADGELTQEEADAIIERIENGKNRGQGERGKGNHQSKSGWLNQEEKNGLVATVLGLSVEELAAAKEAGQHFNDIIETQGMTQEEFKTALENAVVETINQAVVDGELTQEEADAIILRVEEGKRGHENEKDNSDGNQEDEAGDASEDNDGEVQALGILSIISEVDSAGVTNAEQTIQVYMPIIIQQ